MRAYNPELPLVSVHVPKTAGASLMRVLKGWFGEKFHMHYPMSRDMGVPELGPGSCIHGHFPRHNGFSLEERVPGQMQLITFLRNPLEMMISNYNYKLRVGQRPPPVDKFFRERGCYLFQHLPADLNECNYQAVLNDFVFVGTVEHFDRDIGLLADILGKPRPEKTPHTNKSKRRKKPSEEAMVDWWKRHELEFQVWEYALLRHTMV